MALDSMDRPALSSDYPVVLCFRGMDVGFRVMKHTIESLNKSIGQSTGLQRFFLIELFSKRFFRYQPPSSSRVFLISSLLCPPTMVLATSPSLKKSSVGILRISYFCANSRF